MRCDLAIAAAVRSFGERADFVRMPASIPFTI
ncbi:protein of unknown function [Pararobbsia alpina]